MSLLKSYRKWKQRDFLKWRDDLNEYERDFFLLEIKGRCEALLTYCREIDTYCDDRRHEHNLGVTLRNLGLNGLDETRYPPQDRPQHPTELAREFFSSIKDVNRKTFIEPLEVILPKIKSDVTLKEFGAILNEVNLICSVVAQVKDQLFLYRLGSIAYVRDAQTNQVVQGQPRELSVLLLQFKNSMDNIINVVNATSATIHQWHKEQMQWKTEFLKVTSERIAQRNNLLTIILAVAISWTLLTATQLLEKYQLNKENETLRHQTIDALDKMNLLELENKNLNLKIEEMKKSLLQIRDQSARGEK